MKPTLCYYTPECLRRSTQFEGIRTIGAGCVNCKLENAPDCPYLVTQEIINAINEHDMWCMVAHRDLRLSQRKKRDSPSTVLGGEISDSPV